MSSFKRRRLDSGAAVGNLERSGSTFDPDGDNNPRAGESRKSAAACSACRKQKIRCELQNEEPPCVRCRRRGLECILHQPLRSANGDIRQLGLMRTDVSTLFSSVIGVYRHLNIEPPAALLAPNSTSVPGLSNDQTTEADQEEDEAACEVSPPLSPSAAHAPMDTFIGTARADGLVNSSSPVSARRRGTDAAPDLVSRGLIKPETARLLVQRYLNHLDRFLYGLASRYDDMDQIAKASPTLLAAICAVAAFNDPQHHDVFDVCNREYRSLVSNSLFEKRDSEHIRALCIGSFWLPDASRIFLSDALRRAADTRLPYRFHKLLHPEDDTSPPSSHKPSTAEMRDQARLWYLLFISDQHSSILHNRDCIIRREMEILEAREMFLNMEGANVQDVRLISQVSLLIIMGEIRDVLGSEVTSPVSKALKVQFSHFSHELDQWFARFSAIFEPDPNIGDFPTTGLKLHYQFGKLYLGHHVFRGLKLEPVQPHFLQAATTAYNAARAIFETLLHDNVLLGNLLGVPHYFHIMISFAGHFMLDVCMKHREQLAIPVQDDIEMMKAGLAHCKRLSTLPQHPLSRMTNGLLRKLVECTSAMGLPSLLDGSPFQQFDLRPANGQAGHSGVIDYTNALGQYPPDDMSFPPDMMFPDFDPFALQDTSQFTYLA